MLSRTYLGVALVAVSIAIGLFGLLQRTHPLEKAEIAFARGEYVTAYRDYYTAAGEGDPVAQFAVGRILEQGLGPELYNPALAFEYIERSAKAGYGYAMVWLSDYYNSDDLYIRDEEAALLWLGRAADANVPSAWQRFLTSPVGDFLPLGHSDAPTAFDNRHVHLQLNTPNEDICPWLEKLRVSDSAVSAYQQGRILQTGLCDDRAFDALERFERAAHMGFVPAMMALADYYADKSLDETLYWSMVAARMGEQAPQDISHMIQVRSVGIPQVRMDALKARVKSFQFYDLPRKLKAAQDMR